MMTNQEFGDKTGCHHSMASRLRAGKRRPSLDLMQRISEEFGIPLQDLIDARNEGSEAVGQLLRARVFQDADDKQPA